jgi:hypothetical protein
VVEAVAVVNNQEMEQSDREILEVWDLSRILTIWQAVAAVRAVLELRLPVHHKHF